MRAAIGIAAGLLGGLIGACFAIEVHADAIVRRDLRRVEGTIANHELFDARPLLQSHVGILKGEGADAILVRVPVADIDHILLVNDHGGRRIIELDETPSAAARRLRRASMRVSRPELAYSGAKFSYGLQAGAVAPHGDLRDTFTSGWFVGATGFAAIDANAAIGLGASNMNFNPKRRSDDRELRIFSVEANVVALSPVRHRFRFLLKGGIGYYRSATSMRAPLENPDTGAVTYYTLHASENDIGYSYGLGVIMRTRPRGPAVRVVATRHILTDEVRVQGWTHGPTEYFRVGLGFDLHSGFDPR